MDAKLSSTVRPDFFVIWLSVWWFKTFLMGLIKTSYTTAQAMLTSRPMYQTMQFRVDGKHSKLEWLRCSVFTIYFLHEDCVFREVTYCEKTKRFRHRPVFSSMDFHKQSIAANKVNRSTEISLKYLLNIYNKPEFLWVGRNWSGPGEII